MAPDREPSPDEGEAQEEEDEDEEETAQHSGEPDGGRFPLALAPRLSAAPSRSTAAAPPSDSITSAALVTMLAQPSRTARRQPADLGASTRPGTTIASRPCSSTASRAVMRLPLRRAASTTTTPSASPEMIRFRRGKSPGRGGCASGNSEITAPPASAIESKSPACSGG